MAEYVRDLVRKFDRDSDGLLSIQELTDGLRKIGISLTNKEIQALMTKLDLNRDGEVSAEEILKALSSIGTGIAVSPSSNSTLDNVISKMVLSGKSFPSLKDYAKHLIRKWDKDSDGIITFSELCDGIFFGIALLLDSLLDEVAHVAAELAGHTNERTVGAPRAEIRSQSRAPHANHVADDIKCSHATRDFASLRLKELSQLE
jgi:hypothetical protein